MADSNRGRTYADLIHDTIFTWRVIVPILILVFLIVWVKVLDIEVGAWYIKKAVHSSIDSLQKNTDTSKKASKDSSVTTLHYLEKPTKAVPNSTNKTIAKEEIMSLPVIEQDFWGNRIVSEPLLKYVTNKIGNDKKIFVFIAVAGGSDSEKFAQQLSIGLKSYGYTRIEIGDCADHVIGGPYVALDSTGATITIGRKG